MRPHLHTFISTVWCRRMWIGFNYFRIELGENPAKSIIKGGAF
jgi:hypothetical protein